MSLADELNWLSATELAGLIRSKAVSPVELLRSCLATIERLNPKINAICTLVIAFIAVVIVVASLVSKLSSARGESAAPL